MRPDGLRPAADALRRPLEVRLVAPGHVLGDRGMATAQVESLVAQRDRDAVVVTVELDMVVEVGTDELPARMLEAGPGQRSQRGAIEVLEQLAATGAVVTHGAAVELVEQLADTLVEGG